MLNKLKNLNVKRKRDDNTKQQPTISKKQMNQIKPPKSPTTKQNESENIKQLMNIKTSSDINDLTQMKKILNDTFDERRSLINSSKNLFDDFPYLFVSTEIVGRNFLLPGCCHSNFLYFFPL